MTAPMAHLEDFLEKRYGTGRWASVDGSLIRDDKDVVAHMTYRWLQELMFALLERDEPGDRIVADFLFRMTNGSYGPVPEVLDEPEIRFISERITPSPVDDLNTIFGNLGASVRKRLLGGKWSG